LKIAGLAGLALSGAGPTVLALADSGRAEAIGETIVDVFRRAGVAAAARVLNIDTKGRTFL
jgi:homoserine kinase